MGESWLVNKLCLDNSHLESISIYISASTDINSRNNNSKKVREESRKEFLKLENTGFQATAQHKKWQKTNKYACELLAWTGKWQIKY